MSDKLYGVKLVYFPKIFYFTLSPDFKDKEKLEVGQHIITKTERGEEFGVLKFIVEKDKTEEKVIGELIRIADEEDLKIEEKRREEEEKGVNVCRKEIKALDLPMKLLKVYALHDRSKIIFYFTAPGKVDFRQLVRRLAAVFRTRIEMRQIGVRDETEMLGGLGACGRTLCCTLFLNDFDSISVKMAKIQNLSLNPTKISGICGRLMCCLKYEVDYYNEVSSDYPPLRAKIKFEDKEAIVQDTNYIKGEITLQLLSGGIEKYSVEEWKKIKYEVLELSEGGEDNKAEMENKNGNGKNKEKTSKGEDRSE